MSISERDSRTDLDNSLTCDYANARSVLRHPIRSSSYDSFSRPLLHLSAQTVAAPRWSAIISAKSFYHTDTSHLRKNRRPREIRFNGEGSHLGFSFHPRGDTYACFNIHHRLKRCTNDFWRERRTTQPSKITKHDEFDFTYSAVMEVISLFWLIRRHRTTHEDSRVPGRLSRQHPSSSEIQAFAISTWDYA